MAPLTATDMPEWTERAGGRARWADWLERKINPLKRRAREWKENRGNSGPVESAVEWRAALKRAVHASKGRGHYSRLPLTLLHAQGNTAAMWPSIEHTETPADTELALETRLVNDMKTIMSEREFGTLIGHLAAVQGVAVKKVEDDWAPARSLAVAERSNEPPLPG